MLMPFYVMQPTSLLIGFEKGIDSEYVVNEFRSNTFLTQKATIFNVQTSRS